MGIHYYFQVTLNDYTKEGLEPNLPSVKERIETFKTLSSLIGSDRIIWRFDPILICSAISPRSILSKIWHVGNELKGYTEKLVFSFVDIKAYKKSKITLLKKLPYLPKIMLSLEKDLIRNRMILLMDYVK